MTKPLEEIMKDSEVYLRAAELALQDDSLGFCGAVEDAGGNFFYADHVWDEWFDGYGFEGQEHRCFALCFMAAIAKSEGR